MLKCTKTKLFSFFSFLLLISCSSMPPKGMEITSVSVEPGSQVTMMGNPVKLYAGNLSEGENFNQLIQKTDLEIEPIEQVTVVSIVPSVDTKVCEIQTHILGETDKLNPQVKRLTISRDLPMAQSRFAKEADLENISYYSDYKSGSFGKKSGLMMQGKELLARAVMVVDDKGVIQYLQVVPEVSHLPDMDQAFKVANNLIKK